MLRLLCVNGYFMILAKVAVFVGRGRLGTDESISDEGGVIGSTEHLRSTIYWSEINVLCSLCVNVYFMILTKIAVFVGGGLLGTGESISDEYDVIGSAEHLRNAI